MGLMDILSGGMNLLDLPASMIRDTLGGANPFDQLASPFQYENRLDGRDVLENWGLLGQNQEGFDLGDVAGFAADVVMDPFTLGALGRKIAGVGTKAAAKAFGKNVATDAVVFAPMMAGAYGINPQTQWSLPMMASAYGINPQTQWSLPGAAGAGDAVNAAIGLPRAIQGPMTPWAAMGHNRKVNKMLAEGAMPADVARQTRARVVDPSLYDHLQGAARGSEDFQQLQKMQSDWEGTLRSQLEGVLPPEELERALERYVPAQLYHGTPHPYFDRVDLSKTSPGGLAGRGFYTTNIPAVADTYVNKGREWGGETLTLSPELLRKKMGSLLDDFGVSPSPESPHGLGTDLERFLSGDWNPGAIESKAMMRRLQNEMLSEKPFIDASGNYITDPRLAQDIKSRLQDIELASSLHNAPQPLHVQRVMMDSRNPLDLDAALPNPDSLSPREMFEEYANKVNSVSNDIGTRASRIAHELDSRIGHRWNEVDGQTMIRVGGSVAPAWTFQGKSREEISDLIKNAMTEDPSTWARAEAEKLQNKLNVNSSDDMRSAFESGGYKSLAEKIEHNARAFSSHVPRFHKPEEGLEKVVSGLVSSLDPQNVTFEQFTGHVTAAKAVIDNGILNAVADKDIKMVFDAIHTGNRKEVDWAFQRLFNRTRQFDDLDNFWKVGTRSVLELAYSLQARKHGSKVPSYITQGTYSDMIHNLDTISGALDNNGFADSISGQLKTFADDLHNYELPESSNRRAVNNAINGMRSGDPVGWDVFNLMKGISPETTDELFRELGYDALTHTGGQRSGNGELLHRVFIGLDPDKVYKGHGIAPDPVDVWTLQNVLTGMPAMSVPSRAAYAEARSAGY